VPAGQLKNAVPSGARSAGQSATLENPAHFPALLIVTRMGRDYRPGSRQRIEQVARQGSQSFKQDRSRADSLQLSSSEGLQSL
jgi:hypothetical protein